MTRLKIKSDRHVSHGKIYAQRSIIINLDVPMIVIK